VTDDDNTDANADALLKQIVRYAYGGQCRQQLILGYFGDPEAQAFAGCGTCDICSPEVRERASVDESTALACRQALAAVARLNGRFGKGRLSELLKGATSEAFSQTGLQHQSTYGLLREWSLDAVRRLFDRLLDAGYLKSQGLDYPVLTITPEGLQAMKGEAPVALTIEATSGEEDLSNPSTRKSARARRKRELSRLSPSERKAATATASASNSNSSASASASQPADPGLLETLKDFRREEARKRSVPAYVVFHDKTLEELATRRPVSAGDLASIAGLGPKKIELYGEKLLSIFKQA
jgi:ATP-dependent DNA helicase RecQ